MKHDKKKKKSIPSPVRRAPEPAPEVFIGHDSMTMMGDESFADFERRMEEAKETAGLTGAIPAHVPAVQEESVPPVDDAPEPDEAAADEPRDDLLPDEYEGEDEP